MIVNFVTVKDGVMVHRQVEEKDGRVFCRARKRPVLEISKVKRIRLKQD